MTLIKKKILRTLDWASKIYKQIDTKIFFDENLINSLILIFIYKFIKMKSNNNKSCIEPLSFWDQLDKDIEKIGDRAKDKL
jgi:hypothetical protein